VRKALGLAVVVLAAAACTAAPSAHASAGTPRSARTTASTSDPPTSTNVTVAPTTTTTTTTATSTVAMATVPDAATIGREEGNSGVSIWVLSQAGFAYQIVRLESQSCFELALPGQQPFWNGGEVLGQFPPAGTLAPQGSVVDIDICGPPPQP